MQAVDTYIEFDYYPIHKDLDDEDKENTQGKGMQLFLGGSWFILIKIFKNIKVRGVYLMLQIKKNLARSTKLYLEELMKNFPDDT